MKPGEIKRFSKLPITITPDSTYMAITFDQEIQFDKKTTFLESSHHNLSNDI